MDYEAPTQPEPLPRQPWEEPRIVLERPLEVRAQGKAPGGGPPNPLSGFIGPLGGNSGTCGQ